MIYREEGLPPTETFTIPSFAGTMFSKYFYDKNRVDEILNRMDAPAIVKEICDGVTGNHVFGSITVTIEFVEPEAVNSGPIRTGGYSDKYLRKLCHKCYFQKNGCLHHAKIYNPRYKYFRITSVRGDIMVVPSKKLQESMEYSISEEESFNKNGIYDKGHLIAARFGGTNCPFNLVMMASHINRKGISSGMYYSFEDDICGEIKMDKGAPDFDIKRGILAVGVNYDNGGIIPSSFYLYSESHPESAESWSLGGPDYNYGSGNIYNPEPSYYSGRKSL